MKINNKSGFTLIEIIVVLIIVGILAAIALPNLFSNVNKSRAEEALASMSSFRPTAEACIIGHLTTSSTNCAQGVLGNPSASTNFTYAYTGPAAAGGYDYKIVASGQVALANTDQITFTRGATSTSTVNCTAGGALLGAC